jgi:hypothetical protein
MMFLEDVCMNWSDPNQVALFVQAVSAIISLFAVIAAFVAIFIQRRQFKEDWQMTLAHAEKERQLQSRPVIVPIGPKLACDANGQVHWELQYISDGMGSSTSPDQQGITLQNMGSGPAFNIHSVLYGPNPALHLQCGSWHNGPIEGGGTAKIYYYNGQTDLGKQTKVDGIHVLYNDSDSNYRVARLTTTYHDIFGLKYVSIFEYLHPPSGEHRWMHINTTMVQKDLEELDYDRLPSSMKRKPSR